MATTPAAPTTTAAAVPGERRRRHVLLFPLPYQGHITPMFRLAGALHARGFSITVFHTDFNAPPDRSRHPEYRFIPVPGGMSGPVAVNDVVGHILALNHACEAAFRDRLAGVLEEYKSSGDADVACLVADVHLLSMVQVAKRLGVPALALRTGSAAGFTAFLAYPMLCDKGYLPVQGERLDVPVRELQPHRVRDLIVLEGADGHALAQEYLAHAVATAKASTGLILNTFDALERRELARIRRDDLAMIPVFDVGPLHMFSPASDSSLLRQDRGCLEWLDTQPSESVIYISFGSLACMGQQDLIETAWGIADSGVPFLWVVRPGIVGGSRAQQLPEEFEAATRGRGMVVAWVPQEEVLRHRAVGGFWTHNGWNSTIESVAEGVPMLCRPCFGDQMGNARYVEHEWKVGFVLGGELHRASVEAAIRRLMKETDGAAMRARAGEMKTKAAECTAKGGSSDRAVEKLVAHIMSL